MNVCRVGPQGPPGEPGPEARLNSSYLEIVGSEQTVASGSDFTFDDIDIVGTGISFTSGGSLITITRPGLYSIEWSMNLSDNNTGNPVVGIIENGEETSFSSNANPTGNFSSGALVNVRDTPYTISLGNRGGGTITISEYAEHTALSLRIFRFANGAD